MASEALYEDVKEIAERPFWNGVKNQTFLITGGAGFIAYHIALSLLLRNDLFKNRNRVVLLVRSAEKARKKYGGLLDRDDLQLLIQDVCDPIPDGQYDYIIHAAGGAEAHTFEERPAEVFNTNAEGTKQILELARRCKAKSVLYVSSFTVYGADLQQDVISEEEKRCCGLEYI